MITKARNEKKGFGWLLYGGIKTDCVNVGTPRFIEAGKDLGIEVIPIRLGNIALSYDELAKMDLPDFAIVANKNTALLRMLENLGVVVIPRPKAIDLADSKLQTTACMWMNNIPIPKSLLDPYERAKIDSEQDYVRLVERIGDELGFPVVVKEEYGAGGDTVHLFKTAQDLIDSDLIRQNGKALLFQEFIAESRGTDVRIVCVGGEIVSGIQRIASDGFKSNVHAGGTTIAHDITEEEATLAIEATKAAGLELSGVDILLGKDGPLLCEINAMPGFVVMEETNGIPFISRIVEYAVDVTYNNKPRVFQTASMCDHAL